ncbi:MAG: hypothetical protein Q9166_001173 [cf. Caloplaca sp. 2 TL-2023]
MQSHLKLLAEVLKPRPLELGTDTSVSTDVMKWEDAYKKAYMYYMDPNADIVKPINECRRLLASLRAQFDHKKNHCHDDIRAEHLMMRCLLLDAKCLLFVAKKDEDYKEALKMLREVLSHCQLLQQGYSGDPQKIKERQSMLALEVIQMTNKVALKDLKDLEQTLAKGSQQGDEGKRKQQWDKVKELVTNPSKRHEGYHQLVDNKDK